MREIKFRIWDKLEKKYITLDAYQKLGAVCVENDGTLSLSTDYRFVLSMMLQKDTFIVEQYTGLKDKNGKEIYEGDIVKDQDGVIGVVEFYDGMFCYGNYALIAKQYPVEVIGTIHENKELLNGEAVE